MTCEDGIRPLVEASCFDRTGDLGLSLEKARLSWVSGLFRVLDIS
jgi:hypothetical protein